MAEGILHDFISILLPAGDYVFLEADITNGGAKTLINNTTDGILDSEVILDAFEFLVDSRQGTAVVIE